MMPEGPICWNLHAEERTEIRIGVVNSVSGKESSTGNEIRWAYELASADINKKGGIFVKAFNRKLPVRLIIADDESDSAVAAKVTEKLIVNEKVDVILGAHPSNLAIPSCRMAERYKTYYHSTACFIPKWLENNFKYATNIFFDLEQAVNIPFEIWGSIAPDARPQRHALLMEDTPDGKFFGSYFKKAASEHGYEFLIDEALPGTRVYLPLLIKMKKEKIDSVLVFGNPADVITLVRQMKDIKLDLKYLHGWKGTWAAEFWKALEKDAQYVVCDGFWSEDYPYPGAKKLGILFYEKFNKHSVSVGLFYGICQILFEAIEKAGTLDSTGIRAAIANHEFSGTVMGDIKYDKRGVAIITGTAHQWWEGEQKWFYPFDQKAWRFRLMPPWNER